MGHPAGAERGSARDAVRVLFVLGTRPEAIKLAPVILALGADPRSDVRTCVTGQHRAMLDQVLSLFEIAPDHDLDLMQPNQTLASLTCRVIDGVTGVLSAVRPDWVMVQGDTTTAFAAALSAFYSGARIAHVEAGLRTGDLKAPWPEELNRKLVSVMTDRHYAPTERAKLNLLAESVPEKRILVTGNTVIDALLWAVSRIERDGALQESLGRQFAFLDPSRRLVLVTGHRRESFGEGFRSLCRALRRIAARPDAQLVYPVHLNPNVQQPVHEILGGAPNVTLIEPVEYLPFVYLMAHSHIIITDSGGVQEEAPSLGKPVLVMRDTTERPEAVDAGTVELVGTDEERIVASASRLLDDEDAHERMARAHNPYGDGQSSARIVGDLLSGAGTSA